MVAATEQFLYCRNSNLIIILKETLHQHAARASWKHKAMMAPPASPGLAGLSCTLRFVHGLI